MTKTVIMACLLMPNFGYASDELFTPVRPLPSLSLDGLFRNDHPLFPNDQFFTFSPDVKAVGPVVGVGSYEDYYRLIFRHIVQVADSKIHDDPILGYRPGANDNYSYYTFLLLALAIPQHESRGIHFRKVAGDECDQLANGLIRIGPGAREVLSPTYRDPLRPLLPDCRYLRTTENVDQMLFAPSGDVGIMQMNARYHPAEMDPTILMNVYRSINAGVDFIWSGFDQLDDAKQSGGIPCIRPTNPFSYGFFKNNSRFSAARFSKPAVWLSLAGASWSHSYNGQALCSFNTTRNTNNVGFYRDFMSLLNGSSLYHTYMPEGTIERAALDEIVHNFQGMFARRPVRERNAALKQVLNLPSGTNSTWRMPKRTLIAPNYFLKRGKIAFYASPVPEPANMCGYLAGGGHGAERVRVINTSIDNSGDMWGKVELPQYVTFAHFANEELELKKGVWSSPLRSAMKIDPSTLIRIVRRYRNGYSPVFNWITTIDDQKTGMKWDLMMDDQGAAVFAAAKNFQPVYEPGATSNMCKTSDFYVHMSDLKKLPLDYISNNKHYIGVVIGKGLLNLMQEDRADSIIGATRMPGTTVTVVGEQTNGLGERWYQVSVAKSDTDTLWAPAARLGFLREIKTRY